MKFEEIYIDGFGMFHDYYLKELSPGLNIFTGLNEAGKSTLLAFKKRLLFGFPDRRSRLNPYAPLAGGNHGGRLVILSDDKLKYTLERYAGKRNKDVQLTLTDGSTGGERELTQLLGQVSKDVFENIYAFGLGELQDFETLNSEGVKGRIYSAGAGMGVNSPLEVKKTLEGEIERLFKPRGSKPHINELFAMIKEKDAELVEINKASRDFDVYHRELAEKSAAAETAVQELKQINKALRHTENLLKLREDWWETEGAKEQLQEIPQITSFPERGLEMLVRYSEKEEELETAIANNKAEMEKNKNRQAAAVGGGRWEVGGWTRNEGRGARNEEREKLYQLRRDCLELTKKETALESLNEKEESLNEQERLLAIIKAFRPEPVAGVPQWPIFFFLLVGVISFLLAIFKNNWEAGAASFFILLVGVVLYVVLSRKKQVTPIKPVEDIGLGDLAVQPAEMLKRRETLLLELQELKDRIRLAARDLMLEDIPDFAELEKKERELQAEEATFSKWEELRAKESDLKIDLRSLEEKLQKQRKEIATLFDRGAAGSVEEFRTNANNYHRRNELLAEISRGEQNIKKISGTGELYENFINDLKETSLQELEEEEKRLSESLETRNKDLSGLSEERGRLAEKIAQIEQENRASTLRLERSVAIENLQKKAEEWSVLILAKTIIAKSVEKYEQERQPRVIKEAQSFFSRMTLGRYGRIFAPLGETKVYVEDRDGRRKDIESLSRGTAEQLYLALRFGFIREFSQRSESLPVVFDDIFVNFDPERFRAAGEAVKELVKTNQVFYFTCHPERAIVLSQIMPEAKVIDI